MEGLDLADLVTRILRAASGEGVTTDVAISALGAAFFSLGAAYGLSVEDLVAVVRSMGGEPPPPEAAS